MTQSLDSYIPVFGRIAELYDSEAESQHDPDSKVYRFRVGEAGKNLQGIRKGDDRLSAVKNQRWQALPVTIREELTLLLRKSDEGARFNDQGVPESDVREVIHRFVLNRIQDYSLKNQNQILEKMSNRFQRDQTDTREKIYTILKKGSEELKGKLEACLSALKGVPTEEMLSYPWLWEEDEHAFANNEFFKQLLSILRTRFQNLTPELDRALNDWVKEGKKLGEERNDAVVRTYLLNESGDEKAIEFNRTSNFYLSNGQIPPHLILRKLPPLFDKEPFTVTLEELLIKDFDFSTLPPDIFKLKALKELSIVKQHNDAPLIVPPEISQLTELVGLVFSECKLVVSPQIGRLTKLEQLYLIKCQLRSLPSEMGLLNGLQHLALQGNPDLQALPNEILHLSPECLIEINQTGLVTGPFFNRLREIVDSPEYDGPQFSYSMAHLNRRNIEDSPVPPLHELLTDLFEVAQEPVEEFPILETFPLVARWVFMLQETANYKQGGERQVAIAKKMIDYLRQAEVNNKFQLDFLAIAEEASHTCGDRVALSIIYCGNALRLKMLEGLQSLSKFLVETVWSVHLLEEVARNKVKTLRVFDEVEIYLGYPIKLRERLSLEIDVDEMLYYDTRYMSEQDLRVAEEFVLMKRNNEEEKLKFLASEGSWIAALKETYPDEYKQIEDEASEAETVEEETSLRSSKLEELTKKVLASFN